MIFWDIRPFCCLSFVGVFPLGFSLMFPCVKNLKFGLLQANDLTVNILPVSYPGQIHILSAYGSYDIPKTVVANLNQGSAIKSMDFHPVQLTLLVGQLLVS